MHAQKLFPTLFAFVALSTAALAQNFNLDVGDNQTHGLPSNAYGAAAAQPGQWLGVSTLFSTGMTLTDITGAPTAASLSWVGGAGDFAVDNPAWNGDDDKLMEDATDVNNAAHGFGIMTWTLSGLAAGTYQIYTYAAAPDQPATFNTRVAVTGAAEGPQIVHGAWSGSPHVQGVTYALHTIVVTGPSQAITIITDDPQTVPGNYATVNGFQIKIGGGSPPASGPFCFGDGSGTTCPCGNNSVVGNHEGCLNSLGNGGKLVATGNASLAGDTFTLAGSGMPHSFALYFQGTAQIASGAGSLFGDGLRCAGGSIVRLETVTNSVAGASAIPQGADPALSTMGAVGSPGTRTYQVWYRNSASYCTALTYNLTNGLLVSWTP